MGRTAAEVLSVAIRSTSTGVHCLKVLETKRLVLRRFEPDDAQFILELVNDPDWLRFIGDKSVRNLQDARGYIQKGPMDMYARHGFGLYCVELKSDATPIGMCGLLKRDTLEDVDIGFAFLPRFRSQGYGREAAQATLAYGADVLGLKRIVATTTPDNDASGRLLGKIGLRFERMFAVPGENREVRLYGCSLPALPG
jgi:RimJ/RimL family protein N-acetyltransferase